MALSAICLLLWVRSRLAAPPRPAGAAVFAEAEAAAETAQAAVAAGASALAMDAQT
jgi:hypothetical protein